MSRILFMGGVCLSACWDTLPPGAETPHSRYPLKQMPQSRHPPSRHPPRAENPPSRHPREQTPPGTEHAGRYGQCAGGTHPIGIQSCLFLVTAFLLGGIWMCLPSIFYFCYCTYARCTKWAHSYSPLVQLFQLQYKK